MRFVVGLAGCQKGQGAKEVNGGDDLVGVRVIDCVDDFVAMRIGTHSDSVRMTPDEARYVAEKLCEAASRAEDRASTHSND